MMGGKGFGRARKLIAGILASMMAIAGPAQAATVYWSGATSSDWTDGTNWSALPTNDLTTDVAGFNAATYTTQPAMNAAYSVSGLSVEATSGAVTLSGPSTLTLGASGISIAAGAGALTLDAPIVSGAAQTWTNESANLLTVNGTVDNGGFLLGVGGLGNTTIAGVLSGTGNLTKSGAGTLTLTTANLYTGETTVNAGALQVDNAAALGTGKLTLNIGGTFITNHAGDAGNAVDFMGGSVIVKSGSSDARLRGALSFAAATNTSFTFEGNGGNQLLRLGGRDADAGIVSGSGGMSFVGPASGLGVVVFENINNTYSGTITIGNNVQVENNPRGTPNEGRTIGTAAIVLAGDNAILSLRDNGAASNSTLDYTANHVTVTGLSPTINVQNGDGANTTNTIQLGNLNIGAQTLNVTGGDSYALNVTNMVLSGNATISNSSATFRVLGEISDGGSGLGFTKSGTSTLTLGANDTTANTYTGVTNLNGGSVFLNKAAGTDAFRGDVIVGGSAVNLSNANQFKDTVNLTINSGAFRFYTDSATDSASSETLASITMNGGTLNTAKGAPAAGNDVVVTGPVNVLGGTFTVNSTTHMTVGGMLSFAGTGHVLGGNSALRETRLIANGGLTLNAGTLTLNYGGTGTLGGRLILNGDVTSGGAAASALALGGVNTVAPIIDLGGASRIFTVADATGSALVDLTVAPVVTNGSIVKKGPGTMWFNSVNTYTGTTTVEEGILGFNSSALVSTDGGLGNSATPVVVGTATTGAGLMGITGSHGATITVDRPITITAGSGAAVLGTRSNANGALVTTNFSGPITVGRNLTLDANAFATANLNGTVNGTGKTLTKTSAGAARLTGGGITPFDQVTISGGTLQFAPGTGNTFTQGGTVANEGNIQAIDGTLDFGSSIITTANRYTAGLRESRISGSFTHNVANASGVFNLTTSAPNVASVNTDAGLANSWIANSTYVYTGQIYVPDQGGGQGSFSFGESFDDQVRITVDGVQRLNNTVYNDTSTTGTLTLPAGWHTVELRFGQGGGSVGRVSDGTNHWGGNVDATHNGLGFGYDPLGLGTLEGFNYVAPTDNGSMDLFRAPTSMLIADAGATIKAGGFTKNGVLLLNGTATTAGAIELGVTGFTSDTQTIQVAAQATADTNPMASISLATGHVLNTANLQLYNGSVLSISGGTLNVGQSADATSSFANWAGAGATLKIDGTTVNFLKATGAGNALVLDLGAGSVNISESSHFGGLKTHGTPGTFNITAGKSLTLLPPTGTTTLDIPLALSGDLTISGTGTQALGVNNPNLTGNIFITSGTLQGNTTGALNGRPVAMSGGGLALFNNGDGTSAIETINYGNNVNVSANSTVSVNRVSGTGLNKRIQLGSLSIGANTLTTTNTNGYGVEFTGPVSFSGAPTFSVANASETLAVTGLTLSGVVSGGFGLTKVGNGVLALTNSGNTFGGGGAIINVTAGTVDASSDGALGDLTNQVHIGNNSATVDAFRASGTFSTARTFALNQASNAIGVKFGNTLTLTSPFVLSAATNNLQKNNLGVLELTADNSGWDGVVTVASGAVRASNSAALGTTTGGVTVNNGTGIALQLAGNVTITDPLTLFIGTSNGATNSGINFGGALQSVSGNNTYSGPITITASTPDQDNQARRVAIGVDAGSSLTIDGTVTTNYAFPNGTSNRVNYLVLVGDGTGTFNTVYSNSHATPGLTGLQKQGWGTWNITQPQTYTGQTYVMGGTLAVSGAGKLSGTSGTIEARMGSTLTVDDTGVAPLANRLVGRPVTLHGATLNYIANINGASTESMGALTLNGGAQSSINITNAGAQNSTLTFAGLNRNGGDALNLTGTLGAANKIIFSGGTAPTVTNGTVGRVTVNGSDFATFDTTLGMRAFTAYAAITDINSAASTNTPRVDASYTVTNLTAAKTVHALAIDGTGLNVGGAGLTIGGTAGVLVTGGSNTISTSTLGFGGTEAFVSVNAGATLNINSVLTGSTGFTRAGAGELNINSASQLTGTHYFNNGITRLAGGNNTIPLGTNILLARGATLDLGGNVQATGDFYSSTGSTHSGSGGTLTGTASAMLINNNSNNGRTFAGNITGGMSVVRFGQNTWTLNNANSYTGITLLNGGTTTLIDQGTLSNTSAIEISSATLNIDNSGANDLGNRVNDTAPITLRSGTLLFEGRARTHSSESIGAVTLDAGQSTIQTIYNTATESAADLIIASLGRTAGARSTIRFAGHDGTNSVNLGQVASDPRIRITSPLTVTNNLIGAWATNQREWASYNSGTGVGGLNANGFAGYSANTINTATSTDNIRIGTAAALTMTGDSSPYTLLFNVDNTSSLDLGGFTLRLVGGGLMSGLSVDSKTITFSNGNITAGNVGSPSDLYVYASGIGGSSRTTAISANIVDNGAGGAVTLVKGGDHKLTLTGANTYTGATYVNQGNLELNTAAADGSATVAVTGDLFIRGGGSVTALAAGQIKNTANVSLNDNASLTLVGGNTLASLTFDNRAGSATPTVTTGGTLALSGNNAITATSRNHTTTATIAGAINLTGAAPVINVGKVLVNSVDLVPNQSTLNVSANIQGTNGFAKTGDGILALSNTTNNWSGMTTVSNGTLRQTAAGAFSPSADYSVSTGATLDLNGLATSLGSINGSGTISNPGAAIVLSLGGNNASSNFTGLLTSTTPANLSIVKSGSGSLALTNAANNFAGGIIVNAGSLVLPGTGINATGSGLITLNSGAALTGGGLLPGGLTFNLGASANVPLAATAPINTGTGLLTVNGLTTLNLTGAASAGTFPLFKYGNLTPLAGGQFASLKLGTNPGGGFLYGLVNNSAASTVDVSVEAVQSSQTWTGAINGTWDVGITANWGGAATYTSPNQVVFNDGPTNTTITGAAVTPQAITVNSNTANYSIANNIGGAMVGGLTKSGSSILTLTGANSFSGPISVTGGTLRASVGSTSSGLGAGAITLSNGTTLHLDAVASTATPGITGSIYNGSVTGNLTSNKDFANTVPTDTRVYTQVNKPKNTSAFYTGGATDNHTSLFVGKININFDALYGFFTESDDASRLFIDGQLVAENQGNKGTIEAGGTIRLTPGLHDVRIEHAEGTGDSALIFRYQGAGMAKQIVPGTVLYAGENANDNLINLGNSLNISGSSNLNLDGANFTGVQLGLITAAASSTLNVTGPTNKTLRASGASLNGNTTFNSSIDMTLGQVLDNGSAVTITKTGTGRLIFDNTNAGTGASSLLSTSSLNVQGGKLVLKGASGGTNPIGSAAIALNGGGLLLDSRLGSATFDNPVAVNLDSTIEVLPSGQTQTLGSAANGITIAAGKTLTLDVYGGARNGTAGNSSAVAQGAALTIAGPISGAGSNLVIRSTQFNGLQTPVNGTVNLLGALSYTGSTTFVGAINMNGSAPLTVSLGGDATLASTSTFAAPVTLINTRVSSNNATVNLNRIPDATAITLHNSALALVGSTSASRGETVGDVTLASGINQFQVTNNPGTGNLNTLTAASLTRSNRSTAAFVATTLGGSGNSGRVVFTSAPTADLVGGGGGAGSKTISVLPYAFGRSGTASTTPWVPVTHDANGIRPLSTSTELSGFTIATGVATYSGVANDNARLAFSSATSYNAGAGIAFNSFTIDNTASNSTQTATLTGTVTVNSGQVILASSASTNSALNFNGGTLEFGTREANLFVGTTNTATIGSVLSGSGGLTASSMGGMLSLTGNNAATLTGTVTVNGAVLQINADAALGAAANPITLSGGIIRFNAASLTLDAARAVTLPANSFGGFDVAAQSATVASQVTGSGTLMITGGGNTLTLTNAANNFTGPIYIQGGNLVTNVLTDHNITNHGTLSLNLPGNQTYTKVLSGLGSLSHNTATVLTFNQPQAYVGNTTIRTGTIVAAGGDNTLPAYTGLTLGDTVDGSFGTLNLSNSSQNLSSITAAALTTNATVSNAITNLGAGRTLNVSSNGTGDVILTNQGAHLVVSGGGAMNVNAPAGRMHLVGFRGTTSYYGLDVTGLSSFTANVATINVGWHNATDTSGRYGALDLSAGTNSLTATDLLVGYSNNPGSLVGRVTLGTTNTINVDNINLGIFKADGKIEFASGLTNPTLTIRGKAGGNSRANLMLGRFQSSDSGTTPTGTLDLTLAGQTGSIDAMLDNVILSSMEEDSNNNGVGPRGTFKFSAGTVDINSLVIAQTTDVAVNQGTTIGTFAMGGGTLAVNTEFVLGRRAEANAATTATATFTLTGGVATINTPIVTTANATSTLTLNGGTLDMTSKAIGTATDPIDTLNLQSGTLKNVAQINGGGAIAKTTAGTLVIDGVNGYTGATAVNEGTLQVNSSIATSASVTVATGATFVAGATQVVKTLDLSAASSNASILAGAIRVLSVGDNTTASPLTLTGGKMDLNTSALIVDFTAGNEVTNLADLKTAIIAGRGTGVWDGTSGLTSTAAAAASSVYGVGYAPSSIATATIAGVTPDADAVVARYTRLGDANLDGAVNFFDLTALAAAYGGAGEWYNGDFDYSGTINFFDLTALAANYGTGLPSEAIPGATPEFSADLAAAFASVPEPGAISLLGLAALALLKRRNNRKAA